MKKIEKDTINEKTSMLIRINNVKCPYYSKKSRDPTANSVNKFQ